MNIGITGLLTVIFAIAKLAGVIDWSWWWVLAPTIGGFAVTIMFMLGAMAIAALVARLEARK